MGWEEWPGFSARATEALLQHKWPGNVRELRNVVERAVYRWEREGPVDEIIFDPFVSPYRPAPMPGAASAPAPAPGESPLQIVDTAPPCDPDAPMDFKAQVARFEQQLLAKALSQHRFNQRATAEALGLSYDQLRHALRRHDMLPGG